MDHLENASGGLTLRIGMKTDPILYRYSYEWLFRLLNDEDVRHVQLGTFAEMYHLPDSYFQRLAASAASHGVAISSVFTSHRELGGLFLDDADRQNVARANYRRLIEIGALVGARSVGCNPGAVLRDDSESKADGVRRYLDHMEEMSRYAKGFGLAALTIEPMSCLAEPPSTLDEIRAFASYLGADHAVHPDETVPVRYCADISHGLVDRDGVVVCDNYTQFEACLPYLHEFHVRNTDSLFDGTFGFTKRERAIGIVNVEELRRFLVDRASVLPADEIVGYLEIPGPKLGRDYSDCQLEAQLRESLAYLKGALEGDVDRSTPPMSLLSGAGPSSRADASPRQVKIAPSVMCADMCRLSEEVKRLEIAGADLLHFDIMDGHFVPNMPLGLSIISQLRSKTSLPFEVHLMVQDNDFFIARLLDMGVKSIAIHAESATHLDRSLSTIRAAGAKAGVALNPSTPLTVLSYVTERFDFVVLMTVNPGFAGQSLVPSGLRKIADCREFLRANGLDAPIEVDGNVSFEAIPSMVAAGADILVAGTSSVFRDGDSYRGNMARARECACEGLRARAASATAELLAAR